MTEDADPFPAQRTSWLHRRARPAGPAAWGWRWMFPVVTVLAAVGVYGLFLYATDAVLDSKQGIEVEDRQFDDPTAAGYIAFIEPSPTALVLDVDAEGALSGAALLAPAGEAGGGAVVVLPAAVVVQPTADGPEVPLGGAWATGGVEAAEAGLQRLLGIDVDETIVLDPAGRLAEMTPALPVDYSVPTRLVASDGVVVFEAGRVSLDGQGALAVTYALGPGEDPFARADRQARLWRSWIDEIRRSPDPATAVVSVDTGVGSYLYDLSQGVYRVELVPVERGQIEGGDPFYVADQEAIDVTVAEVVTFPLLFPDDRPTVHIENGTAESGTRATAADVVLEAGGRVTVVSNAMTLDVSESVIEVHGSEHEALARRIGDSLGIDTIVVLEDEDTTDIYILLGADLMDTATS